MKTKDFGTFALIATVLILVIVVMVQYSQNERILSACHSSKVEPMDQPTIKPNPIGYKQSEA